MLDRIRQPCSSTRPRPRFDGRVSMRPESSLDEAITSVALMPTLDLATFVVRLRCCRQDCTRPGTPRGCAKLRLRKARGRVDKMICADTDLAALDKRLAELFAIAQSQDHRPGRTQKGAAQVGCASVTIANRTNALRQEVRAVESRSSRRSPGNSRRVFARDCAARFETSRNPHRSSIQSRHRGHQQRWQT